MRFLCRHRNDLYNKPIDSRNDIYVGISIRENNVFFSLIEFETRTQFVGVRSPRICS